MDLLRCSFVGCGGIADRYIGIYRDLPWVRVLSCIDTDLPRAQKACLQFEAVGKPKPLATTEYSFALDPDVDVVVINTPNHVHREQAIAALKAGKHVLLQKPVASTLEDARAIADAAEEAEKSSGLYMSYFDQPLMHDLGEMQRKGWFGETVHFYAKLMHTDGMLWSDERLHGKKTWRGSVKKTGGGCFIQLAVHYIHLFRWIMGADPVRVSGFTANMKCPGLEGEDLASVVMQFESGATASIDTAWCATGEQFSVHGTRGTATYVNNRWLILTNGAGNFNGRVIRQDAGAWSARGISLQEIVPPQMDLAVEPNQHLAFLEAVRDGKRPFISISEGVEDLAVVEAAYRSARTGRAETPLYSNAVRIGDQPPAAELIAKAVSAPE